MKKWIWFLALSSTLTAYTGKVENNVYTDKGKSFSLKIPEGFEVYDDSCEAQSSFVICIDKNEDLSLVEVIPFYHPGPVEPEYLAFATQLRINDIKTMSPQIVMIKSEPHNNDHFLLYEFPEKNAPINPDTGKHFSNWIGELISIKNKRVVVVSYRMAIDALYTLLNMGYSKESVEQMYIKSLEKIENGVVVADLPPPKLYKILSQENWEKSQGKEKLVLSSDDDAFVHFSTGDQLQRILDKYWANRTDYVVLEVDPEALKGRLVFETNPGGVQKYWHLYEGFIPLTAVKVKENK